MAALNRLRMRRVRANRQGISLLEILISIGVVGIGLIGVAALIPLAHHKAAEGVNTDRMAALGRRAFRDFKVRGFDQPGNNNALLAQPYWIGAPATAGTFNPTQQTLAVYYPVGWPDVNVKPGQVRKQAYCFDPLGVADKNWVVDYLSASNAGTLPRPDQFPSISTAVGAVPPQLSIPRISVSPQRGLNTAFPMQFPQADRIFRVQDDLEYLVPADNDSLPRAQQYLQADLDGNNRPDPARRLNAGDFSWMATFVPETRAIVDPLTGIPATFFPNDSDRYTLSIVIFNRRVLLSRLITINGDASLAANQFNQEIVGRVLAPGESAFTASSGGGTKEIHVTPSFNYVAQQDWQASGPPAGVTWDDVKARDWVCLYQLANGQLNAVDSNAILKWYRVTSADKPRDNTTDVILTLSGPDWTFYDAAFVSSNSNLNTYAIFVNNVETVYEKTIQLHNSGAFTN